MIIRASTSESWMYRNRTALGRISIALPIAVELFIAARKVYQSGDLCRTFRQIDKRKAAIIAITAIAAVVFVQSGALAATIAFLKAQKAFAFLQTISVWNLPRPPETKATVYPGFLAMAGVSFYKGYKELTMKEGGWLKAFMHFEMGVLGLGAPIAMELGLYEVRWHHMSLGILSTLTGIRSLQLFGTAMATESAGYWIMTNPSHFGFDNITVLNLRPLASSLAICGIWQCASDEKSNS